jgi:polyisoprenoid-binding protein YceI
MTGIARPAIVAALLAAALAPAPAAAQTVAVSPANSEIGYTVFALGLLPVVGRFQQFAGTITWRPSRAHPCLVDILVQVASLHMDDPDRQREALSSTMLDAAGHPTMHFAGACQGGLVAGRLSMHGVTRPFAVTWHQTAKEIAGNGALRRADYGVSGLPNLVSSTVRIRFTIGLPAALRLSTE